MQQRCKFIGICISLSKPAGARDGKNKILIKNQSRNHYPINIP